MNWITGVRRSKRCELALESQDENGVESTIPVRDIRCALTSKYRRRTSLTLQLGAGAISSTADYLEALGLGGLNADGQAVYAIPYGQGIAYIPAQLIVFGMLATTSESRTALFHPSGVSDIAVLLDAENSEELFRPRLVPLKTLTGRVTRTHPRLTWLLAFPSAGSAAASVYRCALGGRLCLTLPLADIFASVKGRFHNGNWYVTSLELKEIKPTEAPHDFAKGFSAAVFMQDARTGGTSGPHTRCWRTGTKVHATSPPPFVDVNEPLKHHQCTQILELLRSSGVSFEGITFNSHGSDKFPMDFRDRLDTLRLKLYGGHPWENHPHGTRRGKAGYTLYLQLKAKGILPNMLKAMHSVLERDVGSAGG